MPRKKFVEDGVTWNYLGAGTFNYAYKATIHDQAMVYKYPKSMDPLKLLPKHSNEPESSMDAVERAVRVWNEINPDHPAKPYDKGWIAPYIDGAPASPKEIFQEVVEIYSRTGRIVVDALSPNNFIKDKQGRTVCVDVGAAIQLEYRINNEHASEASLGFWQDMRETYNNYFIECSRNKIAVSTVQLIKALLTLQYLRPDIRGDALRCLLNKEGALKHLALIYDSDGANPQWVFQLRYDQEYFLKDDFMKMIIHSGIATTSQLKNLYFIFLQMPYHKMLLTILVSKLQANLADAINLVCNQDLKTIGLITQLLNKASVFTENQALATEDQYKVLVELCDTLELSDTLQDNYFRPMVLHKLIELLAQEQDKHVAEQWVHAFLVRVDGIAHLNERLNQLNQLACCTASSCLTRERGIHGLFSTNGNTKSYQASMYRVKLAMLDVLNDANVGVIDEVNFNAAHKHLTTHVSRTPFFFMPTSSSYNSAFLKHQRHFNANELNEAHKVAAQFNFGP